MTKFHELPDSVEYDRLKGYFAEFFACYYNNSTDVLYALNELLELADRQWHTYELLEEDVREQAEKYLRSVIDFEDEEIMDCILCIIPRIGLGNLFRYILHNRALIHNQIVLSNIAESENEYGDSVDNPYSGM